MTDISRTPSPYVSPATPTVIGSADTAENTSSTFGPSDGGGDFGLYSSQIV